jgi:hypothetical protein
MDQNRREQLGAASGIVAVILILASFVFGIDEPPGFNDSADQVANFVADNRSELQATTALTLLAGVFVIWFLGSLSQALRRAEGSGPGRLAPIAFAGGILAFAFAGVGTGLQWATAYHEGLDPLVIQALWDSGNILFLFAAGAGFAILVGASSVVALTTGALPRLLGWYGALLALYTIVVATLTPFADTGALSPSDGALGFIAFFGFLVWILVTSIVLVRRAGQGTASAAPAPGR